MPVGTSRGEYRVSFGFPDPLIVGSGLGGVTINFAVEDVFHLEHAKEIYAILKKGGAFVHIQKRVHGTPDSFADVVELCEGCWQHPKGVPAVCSSDCEKMHKHYRPGNA